MRKKLTLLLIAGLAGWGMFTASAAIPETVEIDPPMWWIGMKNTSLMLMLHGSAIAQLEPQINYSGITLKTCTRSSNPDYLFLELNIDPGTKPGNFQINLVKDNKLISGASYTLAGRKPGSSQRGSFGPADVIYLIMSDRFANGDTTNDSVNSLTEKADRSNPNGRHGGDIQGIIDHLDYLHDLGITAIWTTPLLEDNQPAYSYHTYAITDYYRIDKRFGTNQDYVRLADECHKRGLKLIMDMVPNHCGSEHMWMKDMPMNDWFHVFPQFTRTNYTVSTWNDPHGAAADRNLNANGWFDTSMPDLNQNNPFVLSYFKQWAIFWIEYAGLDGLRVDTYPYNDKWKIAEWTRAIREEYPNLNIMGECWQHSPAEIAYWQSGSMNYDGYDSYLPTVMDFPLLDAFGTALNEDEQSWDNGMSRLYNVYVQDYLFGNPENILVFLDNHDTERFSQLIGFDIRKYRLAVTHLLTTRGIPEIYYGTEIMMGGQKSKGDGDIRRDFPGGWPDDPRNAYIAAGRTSSENASFNFIQKLLNYRKTSLVLQQGKMIQFIPRDNVYVYFRIRNGSTIMVVLNDSPDRKNMDVSRFEECLHGNRQALDVITGQPVDLNHLYVDPKTALVLEVSTNN